MISRRPFINARAKLVKRTARPRFSARADAGKESRLHLLLSMEINPLTKPQVIKQAVAGFASERIARGNKIISRSEFGQLVGKFGPNHIDIRTMLKRYGLEVEKA
ncbi:MAG: hypothetical protein Q7R70_00070 [Candidatus Diapherotrites archaeon]|nr:hypothetical protein [Candidatus Diapherotrites archaeon]